MVQDDDLVGDLERLLLVVGDEQARDVDLVVEPAEPGPQLLADLRVEGAEGLVEQEDLRPRRQGPGQGHALPLAAGELRRESLGIAGELDEVQQLVDPLADLNALEACRLHLQPERDVLADRHVPEQRVMLEDEPDAPPLDGEIGGVLPRQLDLARVGPFQPGDIRRIVLLPDPDGPSRATSCPAGTSNETPSTAWNEPNRFEGF